MMPVFLTFDAQQLAINVISLCALSTGARGWFCIWTTLRKGLISYREGDRQ